MPGALAGLIGGDDDSDVLAMALPGLANAAGPHVLAQGDARLTRRGRSEFVLEQGRTEPASVEVSPNRVVLRRDAVGVRPLYYAVSEDRSRLAFASRLTQLTGLSWVDNRPDLEAIVDLLSCSWRRVPTRTCVLGARQVPPGHRVEWVPGRVEVNQEWDPHRFLWDGGRGPRRPAEETAERLENAVVRCAGEDMVVLMSGGLDSTSIAAAARRRGLAFRTLSSVYPSFANVDESPYIRSVLAALHIDGDLAEHENLPLDVGAELALHGQPHMASNIGNFGGLLAEAARRGYRTVLDGHDGDSALGSFDGLGRYLPTRPLLAVQALGQYRAYGLDLQPVLRQWAADAAPRLARVVRSARKFVRPPRRELAGASGSAAVKWCAAWRERQRETKPRRDWGEAQLLAVSPFLSESLVLLDRVAASRGLDLEHPFADRQLLEFLLSLPPEAKHLRGRWKGLVREGFPELPSCVRYRTTKTHFDDLLVDRYPIDGWAPLVLDPPVEVPGVDYQLLEERLASRAPYAPGEIHHLRGLALAHRFLAERTADRSR